jgi:hypothetical protein
MAVSASNIALRQLGRQLIETNSQTKGIGDLRLLFGSLPVIKIQHSIVGLATVNTRFADHVCRKKVTDRLPPSPIRIGLALFGIAMSGSLIRSQYSLCNN